MKKSNADAKLGRDIRRFGSLLRSGQISRAEACALWNLAVTEYWAATMAEINAMYDKEMRDAGL